MAHSPDGVMSGALTAHERYVAAQAPFASLAVGHPIACGLRWPITIDVRRWYHNARDRTCKLPSDRPNSILCAVSKRAFQSPLTTAVIKSP